ncbi:DUF2007 domain-containing protein [Pelotomaculum terephthalicicum JT]|uniref:putative signal transducing protein n=1 Tax=Pelotomaculum TaxID=191373 RepID=UPI0009D1ACFC|nr:MULTISPECIES: DUF2007 domain-containing protein [Pelotomaculum]MCG9967085.1 DUF2007 domain-containing protein [Pelotomaculum terephthalicicum JT]OPX89273.1 MAG: hypothetical protein A4E54_01051 [Pelotomaculum sp. PtaB.Bin117]OPY63869.1 MAG: hypothetical protein A4E56_00219 [Pelotomaculum sp. PtaU1.Bin065]
MDKLVTIATYLNVSEAHIVKGLLESEGIQVFIYDEQATINFVNLIGGVRLVVKQSDVERAKIIISQN